jgi:hypothetical protein
MGARSGAPSGCSPASIVIFETCGCDYRSQMSQLTVTHPNHAVRASRPAPPTTRRQLTAVVQNRPKPDFAGRLKGLVVTTVKTSG